MNTEQLKLVEDDRIKARIAGRQQAFEIVQLLEWKDGTGADFAETFLEELRSKLPQRAKSQEPEKPPEPIARLGATKMNFGAHFGKSFDEVPLDYLSWLCGSSEDLLKSLRAYLKHPELEARRGSCPTD